MNDRKSIDIVKHLSVIFGDTAEIKKYFNMGLNGNKYFLCSYSPYYWHSVNIF